MAETAQALDLLHPAVRRWFEKEVGAPTPVQLRAWTALGENRSTPHHALISAPTGEGKTLAGFLAVIDRLVKRAIAGEDICSAKILYISPLKALSNDIQKNLQQPLAGIREELANDGIEIPEIHALVRTGDTSASERARLVRLRPQIIVTTPESFYLMLTNESGRALLATIETLIIDEIHALVSERRGAHLALSVARLEGLRRQAHLDANTAAALPRLQRIGISATVRPLNRVAEFLAGEEPVTFCVDDKRRPFDIRVLLPDEGLSAVMSGEHWDEIYTKLAEEISHRRTTLIFVNNRRLCERLARHLSELIGPELVASHHGSLSHAARHRSEQLLKAGALKVMVATSSLELGLDIGSIDLVVQIASPRSIHAFIQRAGRSEHHKQGTSRALLIPLTRDDLTECVALVRALNANELEEIRLCAPALDVLAQQIVAEVACCDYTADALFALFTSSYIYCHLPREKFNRLLQMLNDGYSLRFGRRSRHIFYEATAGLLHARPGARLTAVLNGGAIPENFEYEVVDINEQAFVGSVHEDFAIESSRGDVFQLGNKLWQITQISGNRVSVFAAPDKHPTIPFWIVDVPGRSDALSRAVSGLNTVFMAAESAEAFEKSISAETGLQPREIRLVADYLQAAKDQLGALPTQQHVILERFFDEVKNCHIVLHSPFGAQINRAWGLALRKRFCRKFNFELQAAANDNAIILSLSHTHSFPLAEVFSYLSSRSAQTVLTQALLDAPVFEVRWRWNASRALAILRRSSRGKTPAQWQKSAAQDLVALLFPDQIACAENLTGPRDIPDHPLVEQTLYDCLNEAMDVGGFLSVLAGIERGTISISTQDGANPSALTHEIINARPYAFLDDAPLEERRTRAVRTDAENDEPDFISDETFAAVQAETLYPARNLHELYDLATQLAIVSTADLARLGFASGVDMLVAQGKIFSSPPTAGEGEYFVSADKAELVEAAFATAAGDDIAQRRKSEALAQILLSHLELLGPMSAEALATSLPVQKTEVDSALLQLESDGSIFRFERNGKILIVERAYYQRLRHFTRRPRRGETRVSPQQYLEFLQRWQYNTPDTAMTGQQGLIKVLHQLKGVALSRADWVAALQARITDFSEKMLEDIFLTGEFFWWRPATRSSRSRSITPHTRYMLLPRAFWRAVATSDLGTDTTTLGADARRIWTYLNEHGASFLTDVHHSAKLFTEQTLRGMRELVAQGLVTSDQFFSLERLSPRQARFGRSVQFPAGRFSLVRAPQAGDEGQRVKAIAEMLLARHGVVYRYAAEADFFRVPWPRLVKELRLMEMRGLIRSGRFVDLLWGEQFAEPAALPLLNTLSEGTYKEDLPRDPVGLVRRSLRKLGVLPASPAMARFGS